MKIILTTALLKACIFFLSVHCIMAQSNEQSVIPTVGGKYVSCGHDHDGQPCGSYTFMPDEVTNVQASPAGPTGGCTPRPYRQLIAYDDQLLVNYTHQQIVALVMKGHKQFADALDSSGISNQVGTIVVGIIPVKIPSYTKLSDVFKWVKDPSDGKLDELYTIKNDSLDADHVIVISREGISGNDKGVNLQVIYTPGVDPEVIRQLVWQKNCGVVNFITFLPNFTVTFAHESGHSVGGGHENDTWSPTYARAYVNSVKQVNCLMKGATVTNLTYNRFSGPNSKIVKNGETIVMCEDTAVHNNAKHISECLNMFWCATENHVTRVSLPATTCGSGKLQAITNNADTFQWKVLSGDCSITGIGQEISYMATSLSKVQVIAQKKGKWYWDTAVVEIPALQHTTLNSSIKKGEFFILPNKDTVYTSGSYTVTLKNQNGCDSLVTINLSVISSTNKIDQEQIIVFPNPVHEFLTITNLNEYSLGCIISCSGIKRHVDLSQNEIDVFDLLPGTYIIQLVKGIQLIQKTFVKL